MPCKKCYAFMKILVNCRYSQHLSNPIILLFHVTELKKNHWVILCDARGCGTYPSTK